jgi:hypothetical protein
MAWQSVRTIFAKILSAFERNFGFEKLDIVRTCCHVVRTACRDFPNSVNFWNPTPCWILIDLASRQCCPDVFIVICWTLRGILMPSKAYPDGYIGTGCFFLDFARTLHGHLLEACDQILSMIWTLSEYMKILNWKPTILLNCNHYIKCFCLCRM